LPFCFLTVFFYIFDEMSWERGWCLSNIRLSRRLI